MVKKRSLLFLACFLILLFFLGFGIGRLIKETYFRGIKNQNGVTNFLLVGIRGFETNGADLTDTMIFVSLSKNTGVSSVITIPRDLWINSLQAKINSAYHYGGFDLAKKTVGEILGQEINYMVVINFESFGKVIDLLGGIEIDVKTAFDDFKYPIAGKENDLCDGDKELKCRYEHLHFDAGKQIMSGTVVLKFVRSRNAVGEEGTDFARSVRQQRVIIGIKQKILSKEFYFNPVRVVGLWNTFMEYLTIDINRYEYGNLALLLKRINWNEIKSTSFDNLLINPKMHYSKQWVLLPKDGTGEEIKKFVADFLR